LSAYVNETSGSKHDTHFIRWFRLQKYYVQNQDIEMKAFGAALPTAFEILYAKP
jgi:hypothetical protein